MYRRTQYIWGLGSQWGVSWNESPTDKGETVITVTTTMASSVPDRACPVTLGFKVRMTGAKTQLTVINV